MFEPDFGKSRVEPVVDGDAIIEPDFGSWTTESVVDGVVVIEPVFGCSNVPLAVVCDSDVPSFTELWIDNNSFPNKLSDSLISTI